MAAPAGFRLGDLSWGIIGMNYLHGEVVTGSMVTEEMVTGEMVTPTGLEPVASRLGISRSILMSYGAINAPLL